MVPREGAAYAEYVTAPSRQFAKAPDNLDPVTAAAVPLAGLARGVTVAPTVAPRRSSLPAGWVPRRSSTTRRTVFEDEVSGVDAVLDLVGSPDYGVRSVKVLRPGGIYIGVPDGIKPAVAAAAKNRGVRASEFLVEPDGAALTLIARLIEQGAVKVQIAGVYPLERVADAHRQGEAGHAQGRLVLTVDQ